MEPDAIAKGGPLGGSGLVGDGVFYPAMLSHRVNEQEDDNVLVT